jgi:hypothetical protein
LAHIQNPQNQVLKVLRVIEVPLFAIFRTAAGAFQHVPTRAFLPRWSPAPPPDLVPVARWQQAVEDSQRFLSRWGDQARALGWTAKDLFGLHNPPEKPDPSYSRLSRYDETGLIWLLQGREVVALTDAAATIKGDSGNITTYRKHQAC